MAPEMIKRPEASGKHLDVANLTVKYVAAGFNSSAALMAGPIRCRHPDHGQQSRRPACGRSHLQSITPSGGRPVNRGLARDCTPSQSER